MLNHESMKRLELLEVSKSVFAPVEMNLNGEHEFLASIVTKNPYDDLGYSTAVLKKTIGKSWVFSADESWAAIQGNRTLDCLLVVDFPVNETNSSTNDIQHLKELGVVVRVTNWFYTFSEVAREPLIECTISEVVQNELDFLHAMANILESRRKSISARNDV